MIEKQLQQVFNQFNHNADFKSYKKLASGHINKTYFIETIKKPYYVLQCINHNVFNDVPGLIENKIAVSQHIKKKIKQLYGKENDKEVLTFLQTKDSISYHQDPEGNYWNLMYFIDKSVTHEVVKNSKIAHEAGKLSGDFLKLTSDFDTSQLIETIPKFHDMNYRWNQFEQALKTAESKRLLKSEKLNKTLEHLKAEMHIIQNLKDTGKIRERVTHNDTKISNMLFDTKNNGICVIDTDTVMQGIIHYDFGDAIRTICNTAAEDETNLDLVEFNTTYYKAYKKGFLKYMKSSLTQLELDCLPLAAKTMMFIMALRFLTDYLNGDVYFKTNYSEHNLDRAKNQIKLLNSFTKQLSSLD